MKKLLVILGPTATGKTDLAIKLAKQFNGEIVSCDSRQVYKGLDIGTGKYPNGDKSKLENIHVWLFDVVSFRKQYTVADYVKAAEIAIEDIQNRGKLPIVVGGTGLYLKALLEGLSNLEVPINPVLRKQLEKLSKEQLQDKLRQVNADKWKKMNDSDRENPRRLIRAIEISTSSLRGVQRTTKQSLSLSRLLRFARNDVLRIGLMASRDVLYKRVDESVVSRINQGMVEEVIELHSKGLSLKRMRQLGLEYGVLADYLENSINSKEELIKQLQFKIHGYVRRQLTWFKKEQNVNWFDITDQNFPQALEKLVAIWYDSGNVA